MKNADFIIYYDRFTEPTGEDNVKKRFAKIYNKDPEWYEFLDKNRFGDNFIKKTSYRIEKVITKEEYPEYFI